jgi:hypothetical protein
VYLADQGEVAFVPLGVTPAWTNQLAGLAAPMACSSAFSRGKLGARLGRSKNDFRPFAHDAESMSKAWLASVSR